MRVVDDYIYLINDYYFNGSLSGQEKDGSLILVTKNGKKAYVDNPLMANKVVAKRLSVIANFDKTMLIKNVLTEISNMPQGFHTAYAIAGTTGNPETTESYRYLIHKTSTTIGWIWAFGADGSIPYADAKWRLAFIVVTLVLVVVGIFVCSFLSFEPFRSDKKDECHRQIEAHIVKIFTTAWCVIAAYLSLRWIITQKG